jgi:hypothetical protein
MDEEQWNPQITQIPQIITSGSQLVAFPKRRTVVPPEPNVEPGSDPALDLLWSSISVICGICGFFLVL